jgi:NADH-quinone oxidoreductase E subunit
MAKSYRQNRERHVPHKLRYQVLMRDRFRCRACGRSPATDLLVELEIDHITPFSKGGATTLENLQTLCKECNIGKGSLGCDDDYFTLQACHSVPDTESFIKKHKIPASHRVARRAPGMTLSKNSIIHHNQLDTTADFPLKYNHNLLNLLNIQGFNSHFTPGKNMEIKFNEENLKKLEEAKSHYPTTRAALMPTLWLAQEQFGWLSHDVMRYVGEVLDIPFEHVLGVAEFYTMYNKKPVGKYHLQVCTNVSCMLCGGYDVLDYIANKLDIKVGDTTPDGKITLSEAECLGSCGTAPMMQVNNYYEEDLSKDKIDQLLEKYSKS